MLVDRRHKWWLVITVLAAAVAVGFYLWCAQREPGGLGGGSRIGLIYGIAGGVLMIYAYLLTGLRYVPSWWWIGSRAFWLKGHLWLGSLSGILILCHSGFRFGGFFEQVLYWVLGLTLLTGIIGAWLQQFMPRRLTDQVPMEVPYEQVPAICRKLQERADEQLKQADMDRLPVAAAALVSPWYEQQVRPFLGWPGRRSALRSPMRCAELFNQMRVVIQAGAPTRDEKWDKALAALEQICAERRGLAEQERLQFLLHSWLYVHVPLSAATLVLGAAHVVMTLYY